MLLLDGAMTITQHAHADTVRAGYSSNNVVSDLASLDNKCQSCQQNFG